jgi:hypothetical protein
MHPKITGIHTSPKNGCAVVDWHIGNCNGPAVKYGTSTIVSPVGPVRVYPT